AQLAVRLGIAGSQPGGGERSRDPQAVRGYGDLLQGQRTGVPLAPYRGVPAGDCGFGRRRIVEARRQLPCQPQLEVARIEPARVDGLAGVRGLGRADLEAEQLDPLPHQLVADLHGLGDDVDRRLVDADVVAQRLA